ncbi:MAG: amino acid adenylation domain-containing protein [Collinsella sp.]|nr:amino acid adenylation domain-containing protein [Collinsella sp.]
MIRTIPDLLDGRATAQPDRIAATDGRESITWLALQERAQHIASHLVTADRAGQPVIVLAEKGIGALASCLGVLYAGGCYVPIDPISAPARLEKVCRALGNPAVLVDNASAPLLKHAPKGIDAIGIDRALATGVDRGARAAARAPTLGSDPAYILFTSGSTGTPKGVVVCHRSVIDFARSFTELFGIDGTDVIGNQAPFDFDVSVKDIYGALVTGARLVILPRPLFSEPAKLVDALAKNRVTTLTWAVSALCLLTSLHALDHAPLPDVRRVLFSGETMPTRHLAQWLHHLPQADFVNLYGPTEVTCNCLYHPIDRSRDYSLGMPLGTPFPDHEVMLLDERAHPVTEAGGVGEIYVRTPQLALGYLGDPDATAAAFVPNPLDGRVPDTVYRTGDLAELTAQGELIFKGRRDNQIKHMGHRIELEEIDLAIERVEGIDRCRCAYDARRHRIHAFIEGGLGADEAARIAQGMLPAHLMPHSFVPVDAMPLSKNGKVDRRALLELHAPRRRRATRPSPTPHHPDNHLGGTHDR